MLVGERVPTQAMGRTQTRLRNPNGASCMTWSIVGCEANAVSSVTLIMAASGAHGAHGVGVRSWQRAGRGAGTPRRCADEQAFVGGGKRTVGAFPTGGGARESVRLRGARCP